MYNVVQYPAENIPERHDRVSRVVPESGNHEKESHRDMIIKSEQFYGKLNRKRKTLNKKNSNFEKITVPGLLLYRKTGYLCKASANDWHI